MYWQHVQYLELNNFARIFKVKCGSLDFYTRVAGGIVPGEGDCRKSTLLPVCVFMWPANCHRRAIWRDVVGATTLAGCAHEILWRNERDEAKNENASAVIVEVFLCAGEAKDGRRDSFGTRAVHTEIHFAASENAKTRAISSNYSR